MSNGVAGTSVAFWLVLIAINNVLWLYPHTHWLPLVGNHVYYKIFVNISILKLYNTFCYY